jgi:DNA polymerase V
MIGLTGLGFDNNPQLDLFNTMHNRGKEMEPLMKAFDTINDLYGRGTIMLGCGLAGKKPIEEGSPWEMKRDFLSPRYTTDIRDIPIAL